MLSSRNVLRFACLLFAVACLAAAQSDPSTRLAGAGRLAAPAVAAPNADAQALAEAGHWKQVRGIAGQRLAANSNDAEAAYLLARAKEAFGDIDNALPLAERAVSLEPGNSRYHHELAILNGEKAGRSSFFSAMKLGNRYKSEIQKAMELDARNLDARWDMMGFYSHAPGIAGGSKEKARSMAGEIMGINPARGYLALGQLAEIDKRAGDAEAHYRKAAELDPRSYAPQITLAWFYFSQGATRRDLAEQHARAALALDPGRSAAYSVIAGVCSGQQRWKDLDSILVLAEKNVPDDRTPHFLAARELLLADKDAARAERYLRLYLQQEPEGRAPQSSRAHWRLGEALEKQGRKAAAISELETALKLEPALEAAKKDLSRLK